ncbi:motility protein A [Thermodesulfobacteriota bacterium]
MRIFIFLSCLIVVLFFSTSVKENYMGIVSNILSLSFVFGGTLIATLISFPAEKIKNLRHVIRNVYNTKPFDYVSTTKTIIHIARDYRREGFRTVEETAREIKNPLLKVGLQLIADNCDWHRIKTALDKDYIFSRLQNDSTERIVRSMAKYAPSFGLAGTIIGLMRIFPQLSQPENIGGAMSLALLTTLYGVLLANLIFLPLSNKMKDRNADEEIVYQFILEALHCIHQKEYSIVIEQRLSAIMPADAMQKYQSYRSDLAESMHLSIAENS